MKLSVRHIIIRSVLWHRGATITLLMVTALIAAVITASLLAGYSVRQTLAASTTARLNGGAVMISAGLRYSDRELATHLLEKTGVEVAPLMELNGSVSSFGGAAEVNGAKIWGVDSSFFLIGGAPAGEAPGRGEVILNSRLAQTLKVAEGGSLILRFAAPSDLPRNTPFAPAKEESEGSLFLTVRKIVSVENYGLFNPSISQVVPYNAFISADELNQFLEGRKKANRFLFRQANGLTPQAAGEALAAISLPGKHSLRIRTVPATGETEIVSDRIFIDTEIAGNLTAALPGARPVITYLANAITSASGSTPYSFVAALTGITDTILKSPYDIAVNEWLADDIKCAAGDSITLTYYLSGTDNRLTEATARFRVAAVVPLKGVWRDSLLMPAFPGITGSRSCTDWDAGIPLDMKRIRDKDEEYWFSYEGTPKAFIRYETGAALWGNQFGPATSIRMGHGVSLRIATADKAWGMDNAASQRMHSEAVSRAEGREGSVLSAQGIAAGTFGFTVNDLLSDGLRAASSGVDFSTLFLALSFFIIGAALVLLIMITDNHLRSREGEMAAYSALGFTTGRIRNIFLGEALIPLTAGAITGTAAGILFNTLIISALNSVWIDAVQTDTLMPYTGLMPLVTGAVATLLVALAAVIIRVRFFLRQLNLSVRMRSVPDGRLAGILLWPAATIMAAILLLILFSGADKIMLHFAGGMLLFTLLILLFRR
ncbi:MAG: FtsX-like permease family protein, partial [Bacteroidetes bacterium]|nr:FtsX-like permease family protein [Bacteroidota bacterium]